MENVYKVVMEDSDGRLVSAILPKHLAVIYRDKGGRIRTAPTSMAFDNPHDANYFANTWNNKGRDMQVWRATASKTKAVRFVIVGIAVPVRSKEPGNWCDRFRRMSAPELSKEILPRSLFQSAATKLARKRVLSREMVVDGSRLLVDHSPLGSIVATDLRLVERV
jgi:hypothetical protein